MGTCRHSGYKRIQKEKKRMTKVPSAFFESPQELLPQLIYNNPDKKVKVIHEIQKNFKWCESFAFSVAFISDSGLSALRQTLIALEAEGKKGRIITSTYLGFNTPKMFKQLLEFDNLDIRIYMNDGFHQKG